MATSAFEAVAAPRRHGGRVDQWLTWALLTIGGVYLLEILVQFNQLIASTYLDADAASAPVIGQLYGGSPAHREVVLGQMAWYSTLMFELATRWLPLHRQIWELAPYAMALASVGLIGWGAWRVAGRWAAAVSATLVLCAAPHTLHLLFSLNDHSATWFSLALLAGLLVLAESRDIRVGRVAAGAVVLVVGIVVGANAASDTLLIAAGVVPVLLAAVVVCVLRPGRAARRGLTLVGGAIVVAAVSGGLTRLLMHHENVVVPAEPSHTMFASEAAVVSNFKLWWQSIAVLGNGNFFGQTLGLTSALELLCAVLSLAAVVLIPWIAWRELRDDVYARLGSDSADAEPGRAGASRIAWCAFWGSSAILLSVGFIVSSTPVDIFSDRYLVGVIYAGAALVPMLALTSTAGRAAVTLAACAFAATGLLTLFQGQATENITKAPTGAITGQVAALAKREHLTVGYAGYWDAAPITWATHMQVKVYPVQPCNAAQLCRFTIHQISSWYTPVAGRRTFLISDPTTATQVGPVAELGPPSAVYHIGQLTMYVYPYDIASHIK